MRGPKLVSALLWTAVVATLAAAPVDTPQDSVARRILVVNHDDRRDDYAQFVEALKRAGYRVTCTSAAQVPESAKELKEYDAVVLAETPRRQFKDKQIEALDVHLRENGAGLLLLGGADGLGAGGWAETKLETVSPLKFSGRRGGLLAAKQPLIYEADSIPLEKPAKAFADLGEFPKLSGFQRTTRRDNPLIEVALRCQLDAADPAEGTLLASWKYEAGRVVVFTSGSRWTSDWSKWRHYDRFVKEMMKLCWE